MGPDEFSAQVGTEVDGPRDLMLYLHVPFCSSKCHFCDFVADLAVPDLLSGAQIRGRYVDALCRQISEYAPRVAALGYRVRMVYWGGGTPSRLTPDELGRITDTLAASFDLSGVLEHSFESSPETLTVEKVARIAAGGVNRISIGVQSFLDSELRRAGRSHSAEQAASAARAVRAGGIENFNLDLIAAMPEQTTEDLLFSLRTCVELGPTHITVYPYRADARTVMSRQVGRGDRPGQRFAHMLESVEVCDRELRRAGYHEYALGHYAKQECYRFRGESHYFDLGGDYLGFGSGAGSMIGHHSLSNPHKVFRRYQEDPLTFESASRFTPQDLGTVAPTLRLALLVWHGIDRSRFARLFGYPFETLRRQRVFEEYLDYYRACGADIVEDDEGMRLTAESQRRTHLGSLIRHHRRVTRTPVTVARRLAD